jgi:hypothetical protein
LGPLQYAALSSSYTLSNDVTQLTTTDFSNGRLRHYLLNSTALSIERAPSPDGVTQGQVTWYDYEGKPLNPDGSPDPVFEGSSDFPSFVAQVLLMAPRISPIPCGVPTLM